MLQQKLKSYTLAIKTTLKYFVNIVNLYDYKKVSYYNS